VGLLHLSRLEVSPELGEMRPQINSMSLPIFSIDTQ
jgi:hypothetical protein